MGRESYLLTRRSFVQLSSAATAAWNVFPSLSAGAEVDPLLRQAIARLEYLTPLERAFILDKGKRASEYISQTYSIQNEEADLVKTWTEILKLNHN